MSQRLCRSPSYESAADFLSDLCSLFKGADAQDDSFLRLQQNLRHLWTGSQGPDVRNAVRTVKEGSKVNTEEKEVAKLREMKKRLRTFLNLRDTPRPKRMKMDKMADKRPRRAKSLRSLKQRTNT